MAKLGMSSSIGMLATTDDGDGVDVGTKDGPRASRWDGDGQTSVEGGNGVGVTSEDLTGIDRTNGDGINDGRLSLGSNSLTIYHFFFPLESCDMDQGGSALPDVISIYRKIILQIINQIEY